MVAGVFESGRSFEAAAHPYEEFSLRYGQEALIRLRYICSSEVEELGGIAYQGPCQKELWTLHFFRDPYLQRESYRVLLNGIQVLSTGVFRPLHSVDATYSDGLVWSCHVGIFGLEVRDSTGGEIIHTSPKLGLIMGRSTFHIDREVGVDRALPLLLILTHYTTHSGK